MEETITLVRFEAPGNSYFPGASSMGADSKRDRSPPPRDLGDAIRNHVGGLLEFIAAPLAGRRTTRPGGGMVDALA